MVNPFAVILSEVEGSEILRFRGVYPERSRTGFTQNDNRQFILDMTLRDFIHYSGKEDKSCAFFFDEIQERTVDLEIYGCIFIT